MKFVEISSKLKLYKAFNHEFKLLSLSIIRQYVLWAILKIQQVDKLMSAVKKFLVILQLNSVLFYLNDPKLKTVGDPSNRIKVPYHDQYKHLSLSYRRGKPQFLNYLFINMRQDIDVAVWSDLNTEYTNDLCHRYFTRYFRDLYFILATNRTLYGDQPLHSPLKIRKDLTGVYNRFPGYNEGNTIVVTAQDNLVQSHARNDLKVPQYSPTNGDFEQDPGLVPLAKYLQGLILVKNQSGIADIRRFISAKQAKNIFKRATHNIYTEREYQ